MTAWESFLTMTATIRRPQLTSVDGQSQTTVAAVVDCWIMMGSPRYVLDGRGERTHTRWIGVFATGTDLQHGDEVESEGSKYQVIFVHPLGRHRAHHVEADLEQRLA